MAKTRTPGRKAAAGTNGRETEILGGADAGDTAVIYVMHNPQQGHEVLTKALWPQCKAQLIAGTKLSIEVRPYEEALTEKQRGYYHGVILTEIAQQVKVNGQKFNMPTWKEYFRDKYLGVKRKVFTDPFTGRKVRRSIRVSSEDLGLKGYNRLITLVTAFATTELGVEFSCPSWERWVGMDVDPETGEIL
jgi:hypothetical protein